MNVELSRFKVKADKHMQAREWVQTLNTRMAEVLETFERESMVFETIFQEEQQGDLYLYWFSIRNGSVARVADSSHDVDRYHVAMWMECIDAEYAEVVLNPLCVMVPDALRATIDAT